MAGSRTDRGLYAGRNVSGVGMCLDVGEIGDFMMDAMCKEPGWQEVGETEDCMMDAMQQESECGWR